MLVLNPIHTAATECLLSIDNASTPKTQHDE